MELKNLKMQEILSINCIFQTNKIILHIEFTKVIILTLIEIFFTFLICSDIQEYTAITFL